MKMKRLFAVLLTAVLLVPVFAALGEGTLALSLDENRILRGMDRSWYQGYEASTDRNKWSLILPIKTEGAVESVTAELQVKNPKVTPFKSQAMTVEGHEEETGLWEVHFVLSMLSNLKNADYPCVIRVTAKSMAGKEESLEIPYTVRVRGNEEALEKPRISISDVQADLSVGEDGEVKLTLSNPCAATDIENLELKISDEAGHILPKDAEKMYLGSLPIGESITVTYPVTVVQKATVVPHMLKMTMTWNAVNAEATYECSHTVAVHQSIRMEQGGIKMPPAVFAGDTVTLSLPLMNMGKADIVNVMATVSMPGITDRQSTLVGTIQPGETKQAQLILTTSKDITGEYTGTVTVECTDEDGNPASLELPVNLKVDPPVKKNTEENADGESEKKEKISPLTIALGGACGLLLILLVLQSIILRRKLHRLEEDKL
ncbi:MAG: hypothetical protein IKZ98_05795 [Clostridia bacterium]|nr:hypothetical protein [Clostridia bacterium]